MIAWLQARNAEPATRVQLIRRPGGVCGSRRTLILAQAPVDPQRRRLVETEVELDALPETDIDALLAAAPVTPALAQLWLVCTHGTRDRCCAKWGMPLFEALRARAPERVWQCSHLGGHRFAPTFLTLPDGLMWGRFDTGAIDELAAELREGRLARLESLRGRCCYPRAVQAAECLVRRRDRIVTDAALELARHEARADGSTRVELRVAGQERPLAVELAPIVLDFEAPPSCGDAPERRTTLTLRCREPGLRREPR